MVAFSHVRLFASLWTVISQAPLSTGFSRQEYWSGLPFPTPRDLPDPGIEPKSLSSSTLAGRFFATEPCGKPSLQADSLPSEPPRKPYKWKGRVNHVEEIVSKTEDIK